METNHDLARAAGRAAIVAGPLFLSLLLLFELQRSAPAAVDAPFADPIGTMLVVLTLAAVSEVVGAILALPTCAAVGSGLCFLARRLPLARPLIVWIAAAAGLAVLLVHFVFGGLRSSAGYAFIGTAMACAAIVQSRLRWE
jgi:hypothetical protein